MHHFDPAFKWEASAHLKQKEQKKLFDTVSEFVVKKNELIYDNGDRANKMFLLKKGLVFIENQESIQKQFMVKHIIKEGEIFGEDLLWSNAKRTDRAIAKQNEAVVLQFDSSVLKELMKSNELFANYFLVRVARKLQDLEHRFVVLNHKSTKYRLKHLIISLIPKENRENKVILNHNLSLKEMGNMVRSTAQTMSSILNDWKHKNLIMYNKEKLVIEDLERFVTL